MRLSRSEAIAAPEAELGAGGGRSPRFYVQLWSPKLQRVWGFKGLAWGPGLGV